MDWLVIWETLLCHLSLEIWIYWLIIWVNKSFYRIDVAICLPIERLQNGRFDIRFSYIR